MYYSKGKYEVPVRVEMIAERAARENPHVNVIVDSNSRLVDVRTITGRKLAVLTWEELQHIWYPADVLDRIQHCCRRT